MNEHELTRGSTTTVNLLQTFRQLFLKSFDFSIYDLQSTTVARTEEDEASETFECLWPFFSLSRFNGMCPITRRRSQILVAKCIHPTWFVTCIALIMQTLLLVQTLAKMQESETTGQLIKSCNDFIYYIHTLLNGFYMAWNIKSVRDFILACTQIEKILSKYKGSQSKDNLARDCFLLFIFLTTGQLLGNLLYFISVGKQKLNIKSRIPQGSLET